MEKEKVSWGIFLFFLILYTLTLAPGVTARDSGEYLTAIRVMGIPHPSGAPLYVIIGKLFSWLPIKNFPWRVNFLSALSGALTLFFLFRLLRSFSSGVLFPLLSTLFFGTSLSFWQNSTRTEVYTLKTVFLLISFYLLFRRKKKLAFLFLGFAFSVHTTAIIYLPLFFFPFRKEEIKNTLLSLPFFLLGVLPYLYLPLRSLSNPVLTWGEPHTWRGFWEYLRGTRYQQELFSLSPYLLLINLKRLLLHLRKEFFPPFLLLVIPALSCFPKKWDSKNIFFLSLFFIDIIFFSATSSPVFHMFLFTYLVIAILMGKGLEKLSSSYPLPGIVTLIIVSSISYNLRMANRSGDTLIYNYGKKILSSLPQNSILINGPHDTIFLYWYLTWAEGYRKDVIPLNYNAFYQPFPRKRISRKYPHLRLPPLPPPTSPEILIYKTLGDFLRLNRDLPIYLNLYLFSLPVNLYSRGALFSTQENAPPLPEQKEILHQIGWNRKKYIDREERLIFSQYYFEKAKYRWDKKEDEKILYLIHKTLNLYPEHYPALLLAGKLWEKRRSPQLAILYYRKAWEKEPSFTSPFGYILPLLVKEGKGRELLLYARIWHRIKPSHPLPYLYLGIGEMMQGRYSYAEKFLKKGKLLSPHNPHFYYNLAILYLKWGKIEKAKEIVQEGKRFFPQEEKFRKLEKLIQGKSLLPPRRG